MKTAKMVELIHNFEQKNGGHMNLPRMYRVRQRFNGTKVDDIRETVRAELNTLSLTAVKPGHRVAITAGSRGIANIAQILQAIVEFFRALGVEPYIFPARAAS